MSPVRYTDTIGGGAGGGSCPEDDFSIEIVIADTVPAINDAASFAFGIAFSDTIPAMVDAVSLGLTFADSVPTPNDAHSGTATWRVGATTASQTGNWTNPTNAQGLHDGANATLTDSAINSNQGTLSLSAYADLPTDLGTWTITSVKLFSYHVVSNFINANNNLMIQYDVGAGFITLATIIANENFADPPREFTLPLLSLAEIDAMQVRVVYTAGLAVNTATINVDAIEFEVIATKAGF